MILRQCPRHINDLMPVFKAGVRVIVEKTPTSKLGREYPMGMVEFNQDKEFKYTIRLPSIDKFTRKHASWDTTLLEEQLATLIHEFIHAYRKESKLGTPDNLLAPAEYERGIDLAAYFIIKNMPGFVKEIIAALSAHPRCRFDFVDCATPIYYFYFFKDYLREDQKSDSPQLTYDFQQLCLFDDC